MQVLFFSLLVARRSSILYVAMRLSFPLVLVFAFAVISSVTKSQKNEQTITPSYLQSFWTTSSQLGQPGTIDGNNLPEELVALLEHDGDYYLHNEVLTGAPLTRCELLVVIADDSVEKFEVYESMAEITDPSLPVSRLQKSVCVRFLVSESASSAKESSEKIQDQLNTSRFISYNTEQNCFASLLHWVAENASFQHLLLIEKADSFLWFNRIFLDLHTETIGLAHTHPWLYWGAFIHDENGSFTQPDPSGVVLSANILEELALLWVSQEGVEPPAATTENSLCSKHIMKDLHYGIMQLIHNSRLQPLHDRRFAVPKDKCQLSSLSITGLTVSEITTMVEDVHHMTRGYELSRHPCHSLFAYHREEIEFSGVIMIAIIVAGVLYFRKRRHRFVGSIFPQSTNSVPAITGSFGIIHGFGEQKLLTKTMWKNVVAT